MYRQTSLTDFCYHKNFEFIKGDVRDKDKFLPLIQTADCIIPLAAFVGFPACDGDRNGSLNTNFGQIEFIVQNTSRSQQILYPNTDSAYGCTLGDELCTEETPLIPTSHYGQTKTIAEYCMRDAQKGIIFRLATVFGVSARMRLDLLINDFVYKAITDGYIVLFEKNFKRNFCHVQDVAEAFLFGIKNYGTMQNNVYNVGNTEANMTKFELCELIQKIMPRFIVKVEDFATDPDKRNYQVSNAKLENLGWGCNFSVEDGIKELIKCYEMLIHQNRRHYTNL
jgi:nucleoside-diphosphate-sugar epimerase